MSFNRYVQNMGAKQESKRRMWAADSAVRYWRRDRDASGFPALRSYLERNTSWGKYESYTVSGWDYVLFPALTAEEYAAMKAAYLETEAGKADTWKSESAWL